MRWRTAETPLIRPRPKLRLCARTFSPPGEKDSCSYSYSCSYSQSVKVCRVSGDDFAKVGQSK